MWIKINRPIIEYELYQLQKKSSPSKKLTNIKRTLAYLDLFLTFNLYDLTPNVAQYIKTEHTTRMTALKGRLSRISSIEIDTNSCITQTAQIKNVSRVKHFMMAEWETFPQKYRYSVFTTLVLGKRFNFTEFPCEDAELVGSATTMSFELVGGRRD